MTYKKRQEVLRAAADWMDVCEKAGVAMRFKLEGRIETESIFVQTTGQIHRYMNSLSLSLKARKCGLGVSCITRMESSGVQQTRIRYSMGRHGTHQSLRL